MNSMIILYSGPVINWDNPMAIKNLGAPLAKIVLKRLLAQKKMINEIRLGQRSLRLSQKNQYS